MGLWNEYDPQRVCYQFDFFGDDEEKAPATRTLNGPQGYGVYGWNPATKQFDIFYGPAQAPQRPPVLNAPAGWSEQELIDGGAKKTRPGVFEIGPDENGYIHRYTQNPYFAGVYQEAESFKAPTTSTSDLNYKDIGTAKTGYKRYYTRKSDGVLVYTVNYPAGGGNPTTTYGPGWQQGMPKTPTPGASSQPAAGGVAQGFAPEEPQVPFGHLPADERAAVEAALAFRNLPPHEQLALQSRQYEPAIGIDAREAAQAPGIDSARLSYLNLGAGPIRIRSRTGTGRLEKKSSIDIDPSELAGLGRGGTVKVGYQPGGRKPSIVTKRPAYVIDGATGKPLAVISENGQRERLNFPTPGRMDVQPFQEGGTVYIDDDADDERRRAEEEDKLAQPSPPPSLLPLPPPPPDDEAIIPPDPGDYLNPPAPGPEPPVLNPPYIDPIQYAWEQRQRATHGYKWARAGLPQPFGVQPPPGLFQNGNLPRPALPPGLFWSQPPPASNIPSVPGKKAGELNAVYLDRLVGLGYFATAEEAAQWYFKTAAEAEQQQQQAPILQDGEESDGGGSYRPQSAGTLSATLLPRQRTVGYRMPLGMGL